MNENYIIQLGLNRVFASTCLDDINFALPIVSKYAHENNLNFKLFTQPKEENVFMCIPPELKETLWGYLQTCQS